MKKIVTTICILFLFVTSILKVKAQMWSQPGSGYILNGAVRSMITLPAPNQNQMIWAGLFTQAGSISSPKLINYNATTNSYTAISGTNSTLDLNSFYIGPDGLARVVGKGQIGGNHYGVFIITTPTTVIPDPYFQFTGSNAANQKIEAADCNGSETLIAGRNLTEINGVSLSHAGQVSNSGTVTNKPEIDAGTAEIKRIVYDPTSSNYKIAGQFSTLGSTSSPKFAIFDGFTVTPVTGASDGTSYCVDYDYNNERIGWTNNSPSSGGGDLMVSTATGFSSNWLILTQDILEYEGETFFIGFPKGPSGPSNRSAIASWNGSTWTNRSYNLQNANPPSNSGVLCGAVSEGCLFVGGNLAPPNSECFIVAKLCLSSALAVEYISFEGTNIKERNLLTWKTAKEVNNKGFEIQSSPDGINFDSIGFISGVGKPSEYEFLDEIQRANTYYRLKQTDYDGQTNYSDVIYIKNNLETFETNIYPNPFMDQVNIETKESEISVSDIFGKIIFYKKLENDEANHFSVDLSNHPTGTYIVDIGNEKRKILKM